MTIAQIIMVVVLLLMISGKVPLYLTAAVGATIAALVAGFPLTGGVASPATGANVSVALLFQRGLHSVILDMMGVLLFVGVMDKAGFLTTIIYKIMHVGARAGGGPGVATAGGIAAGMIGGLTGFTQPAITGVITGPPAVKLGVDKNIVAGILGHAGHLGNFGGFTHPTIVAVIATAGITFGMINVIGAICALAIFAASFVRLRRLMKKEGLSVAGSDVKLETEDTGISFGKAIFPFIVLIVGFTLGVPVVVMGIASALLTILLSTRNFKLGEKDMIEGLTRITVPLFATVSFLYMSAVILEIGLSAMIATALGPGLEAAPLIVMFLVGSIAGLITQSNGASIPIIIPVLAIIVGPGFGVHPLAAAVAAAAGPAIMQYYITGGPVAALATVIPIIEGSDLTLANRFQRPSILIGLLVAFVITMLLGIIL